MKKSQRSRLAFLNGKPAASLSTAEAAELLTLQTLASQNPDASKDEDDSKPGTVEGFMAKFTATFSAKEQLARDNAALQQRITALESGNLGTVTLAAVITALGLKASDLTGKTAAEIVTAIKAPGSTDVAAKDGQITTLTAELGTANTALSTLCGQLNLNVADVAGKDATIVTAAFERVISNRTLAQVKELGFNATALPAQTNTQAGSSLEEHMTAYAAITDAKAASKYYASNIAPLLAGKN